MTLFWPLALPKFFSIYALLCCTGENHYKQRCEDPWTAQPISSTQRAGQELRLWIFWKKIWLNVRYFVWGTGFDKLLPNQRQSSKAPCRGCLSAKSRCSQPGASPSPPPGGMRLSDSHPWGCQLGQSCQLHTPALIGAELLAPQGAPGSLKILGGARFSRPSELPLPQPERCAWKTRAFVALGQAVQRGWPELPRTVLASGWWHLETLLHSPCSCASKTDVVSLYFHSMW